MMSKPFLIAEDIHASYGTKEILRGVSLTVERGEVVAVIGGNGAGKSTLLMVIAGLLLPTRGTISVEGEVITQAAVHRRQQMGMGYLLQGGRVFPNLTVEDNFQIALAHARNGNYRNADRPVLGAIFSDLVERRSTRAGLLSGGQRKMLAVEMVLSQQPRIVLLDEPSAGVAPALVPSILQQITRTAVEKQMSVLLVEQNIEEAKKVANRTLQLDRGEIVTEKNKSL